jgi:hypothetical protein
MLADAPLGVLLEGFVRLSRWPGLPNSVTAFCFFLFALFWLWGPRLFFFEGISTSLKNDNKQHACINVDFVSLPGAVALERAGPRLEIFAGIEKLDHGIYMRLIGDFQKRNFKHGT